MKKECTEMKGTSIKAKLFALTSLVSSGIAYAGPDLGAAEQQATNWHAIIMFMIFVGFTLFITEWRMVYRRTMNDMDSKANSRAIDSLLNYETVKYFSNEGWEARRYEDSLKIWETAAVKNQTSLALS